MRHEDSIWIARRDTVFRSNCDYNCQLQLMTPLCESAPHGIPRENTYERNLSDANSWPRNKGVMPIRPAYFRAGVNSGVAIRLDAYASYLRAVCYS